MTSKSGRPRKYHYFGLDAGNGSIKLVGEDFEERIPSYKIKKYLGDALGSVKANDLEFTIGRNALTKNHILKRTVDDDFAKVDDLEALYLGALAHYPCTNEMHNRIALSSHAYSSLKNEIKAKLNKEQQSVVLAGKQVTLTTEVLLVTPEGYGAVYKESGNLATFDFGNGTTILTPYSGGRPGLPIIERYGVQHLIRLISEEMAALNGGYPGNVDDIRDALERGDFQVNGINIKKIYSTCLPQWWNEGLSSLGKEATKLAQNNNKIICIGGGVALPTFGTVLTKKGFLPINEKPEMVNAQGLYQLALRQGTKKGEVHA